MSINLEDSLETLILALAQSIEDAEPYLNPFILEQITNPTQADWETAWLSAGNTLPISEDQELYWKSGEVIRGQFGRTNDRFYCIFPSNSASLGGVTHFAYTKFLGWEDEQHFLFSGTQLNDDGQYVGLLRAYLDGTIEQVDFTGFTANTLLGYDEAQGKLWYIEGTDLKRIDTTTEVITVIASGITVAPTSIAFDGAGDAFCTINIGAGLDVYRWNNTGATFTSIKASITVNGASVDPGQVITASLNYVVVNTAVANYWVQFARSGGAEVQIKSNPAGVTAPNIPEPDATAWTQILASRSLDVLSIVYTELSGTPGLAEWRRTVLWNMATSSYTELAALPYDDFMSMCISEAPSAEVLNHRRDIIYHTYTLAYRKPSGSVWEYHNVSGLRPNNSLTRQILETDDGQIFVLSDGSSGKIWRISTWDQGDADAVVLDIIDISDFKGPPFGDTRVGNVYILDRPQGYDLIEVTLQSAVYSGSEDVGSNTSWGSNESDSITENTIGGVAASQGSRSISATNVAYSSAAFGPRVHFVLALNPQSLAQAFYFIPDGDTGVDGPIVFARDGTAMGKVSNTCTFALHVHYLDNDYAPITKVSFIFITSVSPDQAKGKYFMVRALRTDGRRQGGSYYAPSMA